MDRVKIKKIIDEIDNISQKNYDDDFNLAMYIYVRYGLHQFNNYICDDELVEINEVLKKQYTLFDEELNHTIDAILNNDDEEN